MARQKDVRGTGEDGLLGRRVRRWQASEGRVATFQKCEARRERVVPRERSADQPDHVFDRFRRTLPVARRPSQSD